MRTADEPSPPVHSPCAAEPSLVTAAPVPNKPKTPHTSVRIPPDLKTAAQTKAATQGRTLTDVIIAGLQDYTQEEDET